MGTVALKLAIAVGGMILSAVLAPKPKDQYGPRLSDINVASVSPGNPIIRHWGTMKLPAQLLWVSRIIETEHVEEVGGGKKGGGGKKSQKVYTYTYSVHVAMGVCKGPVAQYRRIWANQKLIWINPAIRQEQKDTFEDAYYAELDRLVNQEDFLYYDEAYCGAFFFAFNNYRPDEYTFKSRNEAINYIMSHPGTVLDPPVPPPNRANVEKLINQMLDSIKEDEEYAEHKLRFDMMNQYLGSDEQLPNSKIEEYLGIGNVPGYRGLAYFVINNLQLEDFGNSIPQFTVEVQKEAGQVFLHNLLYDICMESGLKEGEFDGLGYIPTDIEINGFAVTRQASGRNILNDLQSVFPFEGAESGYKLVFSWMNERPQAIIRKEDMSAHIDTDDRPALLESTRAHDADMPRRINLAFQEPARNYSPNKVFAQRIFTESTTVEDVELAIAMSRDQAKSAVEEIMAQKFTARKAHKIFMPRKYVIIEPGDRVLVPDPLDATGFQFVAWRCVSADVGANGLIEFMFTEHNYHPQTTAITEPDLDDDPDGTPDDELPLASMTKCYMLDTPLITDTEEDNVGFYTILAGNNNGWVGGALLIDIASGGTFEVFGEVSDNENAGSRWYVLAQSQATIPHGFAMTVLSPNAVPDVWDYESVVRIYLFNKRLDFTEADPNDMLSQPLNAAIIGDEYVQFSRARDLGNGIWELSQFLRGQRGTEWAIPTHVNGERFARLKIGSVQRVKHDVSQLYQEGKYRAISFDADPDSAPEFTFANTGNSLRPFAPSIWEITKRSNGDVYIEWSPRARQKGGLVSGQVTELDQAVEQYVVVVMDGTTEKRITTVNGPTRSWTYTATMQDDDFGNHDDERQFRVYQVGAIIGRGFAAKAAA